MSTVSIRTNDRGKYHDQKIQFKLEKYTDDDTGENAEQLMIKYGMLKNFLACGVYYKSAPEGFVYVAAAGIGAMTDLTMMETELIAVMEKLGSSKVNEWKLIFNNRNKVAA